MVHTLSDNSYAHGRLSHRAAIISLYDVSLKLPTDYVFFGRCSPEPLLLSRSMHSAVPAFIFWVPAGLLSAFFSCGQERTLVYRCCPERRVRKTIPLFAFDDDDDGHTWPVDTDFYASDDMITE